MGGALGLLPTQKLGGIGLFGIRKKCRKNYLGNYRIRRLLDFMKAEAVDLPDAGVEAVICNDGVVLFDTEKDGAGIMLIKCFRTIPFSLNLTLEEMQEFNGGEGVRERYFTYHDKE